MAVSNQMLLAFRFRIPPVSLPLLSFNYYRHYCFPYLDFAFRLNDCYCSAIPPLNVYTVSCRRGAYGAMHRTPSHRRGACGELGAVLGNPMFTFSILSMMPAAIICQQNSRGWFSFLHGAFHFLRQYSPIGRVAIYVYIYIVSQILPLPGCRSPSDLMLLLLFFIISIIFYKL